MKKGFTLIELLVVVLIIGILAAIALPQYTKAVEKSRASEAQLMLKAIVDAGNRYFLQHSTYVDISWDDLDIGIANATGDSSTPAYTSSYSYVMSGIDASGMTVTATRIDSAQATLTGNNSMTIAYTNADGSLDTRTCASGASGGGNKTCKALGATCSGTTACTF